MGTAFFLQFFLFKENGFILIVTQWCSVEQRRLAAWSSWGLSAWRFHVVPMSAQANWKELQTESAFSIWPTCPGCDVPSLKDSHERLRHHLEHFWVQEKRLLKISNQTNYFIKKKKKIHVFTLSFDTQITVFII